MFDLATSLEVDDITTVPSQFQTFYKDNGAGKFIIDNDNPTVKGAFEAITGLNKALNSERRITQGLKGKAVDLSPLAEYGATVDEIKAGIAAKMEELQQSTDSKASRVNVQKVREELERTHAADKAARDKRIGELSTQVDSLLVDKQASAALAGQKAPHLILPFIAQHVRVVDEDGSRRVVVVDEQGNTRFNAATGQQMNIGDLVGEMKKNPDYQRLFDSEAPGGMPRPGNSQRPVQGGRPGADLSPTAKIAANLPKFKVPGLAS